MKCLGWGTKGWHRIQQLVGPRAWPCFSSGTSLSWKKLKRFVLTIWPRAHLSRENFPTALKLCFLRRWGTRLVTTCWWLVRTSLSDCGYVYPGRNSFRPGLFQAFIRSNIWEKRKQRRFLLGSLYNVNVWSKLLLVPEVTAAHNSLCAAVTSNLSWPNPNSKPWHKPWVSYFISFG